MQGQLPHAAALVMEVGLVHLFMGKGPQMGQQAGIPHGGMKAGLQDFPPEFPLEIVKAFHHQGVQAAV